MRIPKRKPGKFSEIKPDPLLSEEKFIELKKKLSVLKNKQPHTAAEVARLAEMGDFSENAAYQMAKGRLRGLNQKIFELEYQLDHAIIIPPQTSLNTVQIGHTVTIENKGKKYTYKILGSAETSPQAGIISHTSPIGRVLLGHKVGEKITVQINNKKFDYTILEISTD